MRAWAMVTAAVLGISLAAPIGSATAAPALAVAFWRAAFGAAATAPVVALTRRQEVAALDRRTVGCCLLSGLFLATHFALWIPSLRLTSVTVSTALVVTGPVWTVGWQRLRGERVPGGVVFGVGLAFAGVLVMTGVDAGTSSRALLGDLLALGGGIAGAAYTLVGASVRRTTSTGVYTLLAYAACAALVAPVCLLAGLPLAGWSARTWSELAVLAVAAQLVGHTLLNAAVPVVGATPLSLAILFEIPGASLVAWVWLRQVPAVGALPGALLVLVGLALVVRARAALPAGMPPPVVAQVTRSAGDRTPRPG
jgi:drug/metabolite transporter (DMT)-like permease